MIREHLIEKFAKVLYKWQIRLWQQITLLECPCAGYDRDEMVE